MFPHLDDEGVSVIVGTLLLILITVTAAAGLAVMVSELQKQEMNRQSHLAQVNDEELKIMGIQVHNDADVWKNSVFNVSNSTNWSSIDVTVLNMNIGDSYIIAISINDKYANVTCNGEELNVTAMHSLINATQKQDYHISFIDGFYTGIQAFNVSEKEPIKVRVLTSLYNIFEQTFRPPIAIAKVKIDTEDLGVTQRDVVVLDGSDSTSDNEITTWNWTIVDGSRTYPAAGNWSDPLIDNFTVVNLTGKMVRFRPTSAGPFRMNLTVTDSASLKGTSNELDIPLNPNLNPPTDLVVKPYDLSTTPPSLAVQVVDNEGKGIPNAVVSLGYMEPRDLSFPLEMNKTSDITDDQGLTYFSKASVPNSTGIIRISSGQLPSRNVKIPDDTVTKTTTTTVETTPTP